MHHAFQLLRPVKGLLRLEQEYIAGQWKTANRLAVLAGASQCPQTQAFRPTLTGRATGCPRCW